VKISPVDPEITGWEH